MMPEVISVFFGFHEVSQIYFLQVINFLLQTEIIPLCLRIMETGSELSKTVATFIIQKVLMDDRGLSYICATYERFFAVGKEMGVMTIELFLKTLI